MSYDSARADVDATLAETGLDYVDLYLLHAPYGGREARLGAWKALVEAVEAGKVRSIGVSNYGVHHLDELEAWIKETEEKEGKGKGGVLSVNQVELHPWCARGDIDQWCRQRGVLLEVSVDVSVMFAQERRIDIGVRLTVHLCGRLRRTIRCSCPWRRNMGRPRHRSCSGGACRRYVPPRPCE